MEHRGIDTQSIKLGIVCPMANESETAIDFIRAVLHQCNEFKQVIFFVVLDHASKDRTKEFLQEFSRKEKRLNVVWAPENQCVVDAYIRGYREAIADSCDWILEIDAGFSHNPLDLPGFFEKMKQGFDCVFGSRFISGGAMKESPLQRILISRGGSVLVNLLLGTRLTDMTSGFEIFTRDTIRHVLDNGISSRGHFFQTEIKVHCRNMHFEETPIRYRAPSASMNRNVLWDALINLKRLFIMRLQGSL